jgi:hypothetical protein
MVHLQSVLIKHQVTAAGKSPTTEQQVHVKTVLSHVKRRECKSSVIVADIFSEMF